MAKKRTKPSGKAQVSTGEPKFPYTTEPKALRRLLAEIPKRPKPPKLTFDTLKAWNVSKNSNARTAIGVLKRISFLTDSSEPTQHYVDYMKTGSGPGVLGARLRDVYRVLFENSHAPQSESDEELKKLFHIHSGGGADAMRLQVQTFKALSEYAKFDASIPTQSQLKEGQFESPANDADSFRMPPVQVDLHIHLPENKTSREYEAIIQDIAKYIYGRTINRN